MDIKYNTMMDPLTLFLVYQNSLYTVWLSANYCKNYMLVQEILKNYHAYM